ncbi:hypothetical protein IV498_15855 [Paenarthrobacter sp. Z7-10]|uniref:hypothetical protein n=1 Tax=Paenarthrobacter sp. Z7-10 TaxID=2787635 RepID=UPI0022A97AD9|nr:hypothetical protein [Paenarthrobacter sp. Z7-10]MCZ2404613.1 hypothetical protein [Paenarthrobacter sp. Z7-10]
MTAAPFRLLRVGIVGFAILALAAGGHLAAGGQLPGPAIMAALAAITLIPVALLTRSKLSFPVLLALLETGQLVLHTAFCSLTRQVPTGPAMAGLPASAMPDMMMPGVEPDWGGTPTAAVMAVLMPGTGMAPLWGPAMIGAHLLAVIATAALLARGEQTLWNLVEALRPLLGLAHRPVIVHTPTVPTGHAHSPRPTGHGHWRLPALRGPPALPQSA